MDNVGLASVARALRLARAGARAAVAAMIVASSFAWADANGTFASPKRTLDLDGTYAFWAKSAAPSGGDVIKVAVSNAEFTDGFFDDYYDREHAIDTIFVDDRAKVVYFEFEPDGKYHGLSYFFAPGENCGYCFDSAVQSTVRIVGGRLKGKLASARVKPLFDVDVDVPMPTKDRGNPLPADGGDPGRAYLAYHKALNASDRKAVYALLDAKRKAFWDKWTQKGVDVMDTQWDDFHSRMTSVRISGGFVHGDRAVILVDGSSKLVDRLHGEALMRREDGAWRLHDELTSAGAR